MLRRSIRLRNPCVDPLNYIQIKLLRRFSTLESSESPEGREILPALYLMINDVAAGLRNTG